MKPTTKQRLLEVAARMFAEKGFRGTTVAEISEKAEANIAAVNYHFGDKERLYDEVWRYTFAITADQFPIDADVSDDSEAEAILLAYAKAVLYRIFNGGKAGLFPKLLNQEMANPTLALEKIASEALLPQSQQVEKALTSYFGDTVDPHTFWLCKHSIIGQCAFYNFSRPLRERVTGCGEMAEEDINQIAHHIVRFSMGGLKEIQRDSL